MLKNPNFKTYKLVCPDLKYRNFSENPSVGLMDFKRLLEVSSYHRNWDLLMKTKEDPSEWEILEISTQKNLSVCASLLHVVTFPEDKETIRLD